ncbi:MAG: PTS glucose transporter subunit IIA [Erysipelotrichaceae bacterium]|nr:PTS glucose transporter subunit IIA [Erysipelotrichaceae bacterium]
MDENNRYNQSERRGKSKQPFKKKEKRVPEKKLYAPANGTILPLSNVSDPVFAQKMLGEGIAIKVDGDTIVSPCFGTVVMISPTKHAIGIENEFGDQILVHAGMDTAAFNGKGFDVMVSEGQKVRPGVPILKLDRKYLDFQNADLTTPMTITNHERGLYHILEGENAVAGKTPVMERR